MSFCTKLECNTNFFVILFHCVCFPIMQLLNTIMGDLNVFHIKVNEDYYPNMLKMKDSQHYEFILVCVLQL